MKINIMSCIVISALKVLPTVLLNFLIIVVTFRSKSDSTTTRSLLVNLVIVDLSIGSFTSPFAAVEFTMIYQGKDPCFLTRITATVSFILGAVSFLTLAALAIDSFLLFCYPFWHEKVQKKVVIGLILSTIWTIPLYPMIHSSVIKSMKETDIFIMITGTVIVAINIFCYSMIYRVIRRHRRQIRISEMRLGDSRQSSRNKSVVICAVTLLIATILCYFPITALSSLSLITNRSNKRLIGYFTYWAWTFASLNSLLNPILKFYRLASIRKAIRHFWIKRPFRSSEDGENNFHPCSIQGIHN